MRRKGERLTKMRVAVKAMASARLFTAGTKVEGGVVGGGSASALLSACTHKEEQEEQEDRQEGA